ANCISRLLVIVEVIRPKMASPNVRSGALNCAVFRKLNASQRNCTRCDSLIGNSLNSAKSQVFCAGASISPTPAVPYPLGPTKVPAPGQPLHLARTNASVLNQRLSVRPSITRSTLAPGTTFGRGELALPVFIESPVCAIVTGKPEVSCTIP